VIAPGPVICAGAVAVAATLATAAGATPNADLVSAISVYGPMGLMLAWFAFMGQRFLEKVVSTNEKAFADLLTELRRISHRLSGLERAMLADIISRESTGAEAKRIAQQMLTRIENSDDNPSQ
jgi:hypothetical protein